MVVYFVDTPPTEGVMFTETDTTIKIDHRPVGCGTMYLTESTLSWFSTALQRGLSIPWKNVIMHAKTSTPDPAIYAQVDTVFRWDNNAPADQSNDNPDECSDEEPNMTEVWFLPEKIDSLTHIYEVMNECQAMNPDPEAEKDDEDADSDFEEWHENGGGDIQRLSIHDVDEEDEGQFEDAE